MPLTRTNFGNALHLAIPASEGGLKEDGFAIPEQLRAISHERLSLGEMIRHNQWSLADVFERFSEQDAESGMWAFFNGQVRHLVGASRSTLPLRFSPGVSSAGMEYRDLALETLSRDYTVGTS